MYSQVLNPVQIATLVVQSYPVKPDLLAIASAIAMEENLDVSGNVRSDPTAEGNSIGLTLENQGTFAPLFLNGSCGSEVSSDPIFSKVSMSARHP